MPRPRASASSALALAVLLAVVAAVDLIGMPAVFWIGDPAVWREEARVMLHGHLAVDSQFAEQYGEPGQFFVPRAGAGVTQWYSKYGIANSVMSLPPMLVDEWQLGRARRPGEPPDVLIYNVYQILLSLLLCASLYLLTGRYTSRTSTRVVYVLAVMFGTFVWYYQRAQSSELTQVLFFTAFFYSFTSYLQLLQTPETSDSTRRLQLMSAWLSVGLLTLTRFFYGALLPLMVLAAAAVIWRMDPDQRQRVARREAISLIVPPAVITAIFGWVNWLKFGSPFLTGYHAWRPDIHWPELGRTQGLYGYLFDMQASMLWYFPVLLFALAAGRRFFRRYPVDTIVMIVAFGLFYVVLGQSRLWRGGWTYGPRYLVFGLPVLALPFLAWIDGLLDRPRYWLNWVAGAVTAGTLVYSGFLTERQNRLDFFVYYRVSEPLEPFWDATIARYFLNHHQGWVSADLLAHRHHLEELQFVADLDNREPPFADIVQYKNRLFDLVSKENYYWSPPERRLVIKR